MEGDSKLAFLRRSSDMEEEKDKGSLGSLIQHPKTDTSNNFVFTSELMSSLLRTYSYFLWCVPASAQSPSKSITDSAKTPYDDFNGSFSFVITMFGAPRVGKTFLCQRLQSVATDIKHRYLFKFSTMPPDVQVSIKVNTKDFNIGVYDSLGFTNPEMLNYVLKGQKDIGSSSEANFMKQELKVESEKSNKNKRINSEGFIVVFDVGDFKSFETACKMIEQIFEYFNFEPKTNLQCPVSIFLVGNKTDHGMRMVSENRVAFYLEQVYRQVTYFETSAKENKGVMKMFDEMCLKIEVQRMSFQSKLEREKSNSFWA